MENPKKYRWIIWIYVIILLLALAGNIFLARQYFRADSGKGKMVLSDKCDSLQKEFDARIKVYDSLLRDCGKNQINRTEFLDSLKVDNWIVAKTKPKKMVAKKIDHKIATKKATKRPVKKIIKPEKTDILPPPKKDTVIVIPNPPKPVGAPPASKPIKRVKKAVKKTVTPDPNAYIKPTKYGEKDKKNTYTNYGEELIPKTR